MRAVDFERPGLEHRLDLRLQLTVLCVRESDRQDGHDEQRLQGNG